MLLSLSIRDFVLVDCLDLEFNAGFSVLTGETGAGKSIMLDALQLALGERAESGVVRDGAERAEVAAAFAVTAELTTWLTENGLDSGEDELLLRRVVDAGGRSRAFINGRPATQSQLKEAGEFLVDIHGQHAHYSLLRPGVQRQMLDAYSGSETLAVQMAEAFRAWQKLEKACTEAERHATEAAAERERLQWQVDELVALDFRADDWLALQDDHRRLAHAAELIQGAQQIVSALEEEGQGAIGQLQSARNRLTDMVGIDPALKPALEMLDSSLIQAEEAARELGHYAERVELDPDLLDQAEARLAQVNDAARKFRARPEELPVLLNEASVRLTELERLADSEGLRKAADKARGEYEKHAAGLSAKRKKGAASLAKSVSQAMQQLSMQGGSFAAVLEPCAPEAGGLETVEFQVSPHAGQGLKPLAKTASGGELSRIGLALQTILSQISGAPTLIFDEVDSGIGGGVAEIVGRMLAELGQTRQVLCVTHLPQVAASAAHHFQVSKETVAGQARSRVQALDENQRVGEIARMLGGVKITDTTRRHAEEMLGSGA
ncbi:MAG: DNA repair protein RecN [Parasulfuritortus sp.]|jgi:DNA repair protein RecN (Recombination protein N)|nr:DNA repair protein RecN [Parasulfuritortus sp.]